MKTKKQFIVMALFAVVALAVIGCKQEPVPVAQSKTFVITARDGTTTVNVTVNYTALPGVVPSWMSNLELVIRGMLSSGAKTGNLTINVVSGNGGFTIVSGKLTVGESWITGKSADDIAAAIPSITDWTAMIKPDTPRACHRKTVV